MANAVMTSVRETGGVVVFISSFYSFWNPWSVGGKIKTRRQSGGFQEKCVIDYTVRETRPRPMACQRFAAVAIIGMADFTNICRILRQSPHPVNAFQILTPVGKKPLVSSTFTPVISR